MVLMDDYSGPCFGCSVIEGCNTPERKQKAVACYCKGISMEINSWKAMLYDVVTQEGALEGQDKAKVADTLTLIKSIVRELDMAVAKMQDSCPSDMATMDADISNKFKMLRSQYTKAMETFSPGWLGG